MSINRDTITNAVDTIKEKTPFVSSSDTDDEPVSEEYESVTHHARTLAPSSIKFESDAIRSGERWAKVLFIANWPEAAKPGLLELVTTHPSADVDFALHAAPICAERAVSKFDEAVRELQTTKRQKQKNNDPSIDDTLRRLKEHRHVLSDLREGKTSVLNVSCYLLVRGDTKRAVDSLTRELKNELQKRQMTAKTVDYRQGDAMVSVSPIAKDAVNAKEPMLSGAVGALFPFSAGTIIEKQGILIGYHATTDAPLIVDRFDCPNGYNVLTAGEIGAGKSFGSKLFMLRHAAKAPDTKMVLIDPLNGFDELATTLGAERVVIGGKRGLNPLKINATPPDVLANTPDDFDPFENRFESVMGFFDAFFRTIGGGNAGMSKIERNVMDRAIREAYRRNGIMPDDPSTHGNPSPTPIDVHSILGEVADDAGPFMRHSSSTAPPTDRELELWENAAAEMRSSMHSFLGGEFANLSGEGDGVDFDSDIIYIDMQQGEGRQGTSLMLQLVLNEVYERSKEYDGNVIVAIDECHYMFGSSKESADSEKVGQLDWLETRVRHSRHYNLSIHFITQEAQDFFIHPMAETIANLCALKVIFRLPNLSPADADKLRLTSREADFVRNALPGTKDRGFSHALLEVEDVGKFPAKVTALPEEAALIDDDMRPDEMHEQLHADANMNSDADADVGETHEAVADGGADR
ncbi:VirB4 family type IV secretion system protein [Halegenticoccus tardaugens]|uniref:VirB4 family type IV secretion system protein n=1 Tax=Halegenticoccus tardaugens TaxID=2071624 RepID=UPI001E57D9F8|nr:transfer complex protein [Halegenticoccus tardaugens]